MGICSSLCNILMLDEYLNYLGLDFSPSTTEKIEV